MGTAILQRRSITGRPRNRHLGAVDRAEVIRLHDAGLSLRHIGAMFGRNHKTINYIVNPQVGQRNRDRAWLQRVQDPEWRTGRRLYRLEHLEEERERVRQYHAQNRGRERVKRHRRRAEHPLPKPGRKPLYVRQPRLCRCVRCIEERRNGNRSL